MGGVSMEWKEVRLGDIVSIKSGLAYKGAFIGKGENILLGMGCVSFKDKFLFSGARPYEADCEDKYCVEPGDIVLATRQQSDNLPILAMPAIIPASLKAKKIIYGTNLYKVENHSEVTNDFLFWQLKTPDYIDYISSVKTGSVVRMVTKKNVEDYVFRCPPKEVRDRISKLLWGLDRKIELNNKINADLEEMAQAIFKNWFVDFEPFKDGKFVDSELGMIPEGWKVGSYSEMIESLISGDWGKENPQGNYTHEVACVRGCDFQDINNGVRGKTPQRYILEKNYQAKHLKDKDILVEISGGTATVSTGRTSLVTEELLKKYKHDIVCTNFCKVLRPLSQFSSYVYYSWKYKYDNDIMFGYENGTSGIKNFAIKDFIEKEPVLIPKEQDIAEFQKIIDNLQKQKQIKGTENTTLSLLRDTLLPRLMSGELEVPE